MTPGNNSESGTDASTATDNQGQNPHVVFIDGTGDDHRHEVDEDIVDAVTLIKLAGYDVEPEEYILEALRGQSGSVVQEFDPQGENDLPTTVDLTDQHRKHFQVSTRGEVFI